VARADRLGKKTGLSWVPVTIYVAVVVVAGAGLFTWDYLYRRRQEEAMKPPPPDVLAKNLVENIIGRGSVKEIKVDEAAGTVDVKFESATYPPAARATVIGEVVSKSLDQVMVGLRVVKGDPLVYVRTNDGKIVLAAQAEYTGRVVQVLVKPGDKVEDGRAMVLIEPEDKVDARKNLETEGLLASQMIMSQLNAIKTVTAKIIYKDITLATVVGKRGEKTVTTTYHPSLE
jgi:biotin carboxyl carrier protein